MKKHSKSVLTKSGQTTTLRRMPKQKTTLTHQKRLKSRALRHKKLAVLKRYQRFFVQPISPSWQNDSDNSSLEQPSPLRWVPSETTYGIGG
jgi:hypothetical protein